MSTRQRRKENSDRIRTSIQDATNMDNQLQDENIEENPNNDPPENATIVRQPNGLTSSPPPSPESTSPPIPIFSLTPYCINRNIIDLASTEGRKLYEKAVSPLDDDKFDCQSDHLRLFLNNLSRRALTFGWDSLNNGILIMRVRNKTINILRNYGEISLYDIREIEENKISHQTRRTQDSVMLFHCIMNSITSDAKTNITIWESEYMVHNIPSGPLLLKIIIRESHIDTNATSSAIRLRLSNLDTYINNINDNIPKFNIYVREQMTALAARGQTSDDLLTNLFKGYLAVTDRNFHRYIEEKQERYEEGTLEISINQLMHLAKTKYNIIQEKGMWQAPSVEESKILALTTEITKLKHKGKGMIYKKNKHNIPNKPKRNHHPQNEKPPDWMFIEPTANEQWKSKTWKNKQWYWCGKVTGGYCERYRIHRGKDCYGPQQQANKRKTIAQNQTSTTKRNNKVKYTDKTNKPIKQEHEHKKIRLSKALEAIHETNMYDEDNYHSDE